MNSILPFNRLTARLLLTVIVFAVFSPILAHGFAIIDDNWMLYNNYQVYSLSIENVWGYFSHFSNGQYSPVNTLAYGLINHAFGMKPFWFHLFSIFLHITNVLLVFTFIENLLRMYNESVPNMGLSKNNNFAVAFFVAFLFGIHPMQVESVAWIGASKVLLYSLFFLLALINYLKYLESKKRKHLYFALLLFVVSFGAKEQTVIFPLCLVAIDYLLGRNFTDKNVLSEKAIFFLFALLLGSIELVAQETGFHFRLEHYYYPFWQRVFIGNYSFFEYIFKGLVPINLSKFYAFPMKSGESIPTKYWFYPILLIAFIWYLRQLYADSRRLYLFGILFFAINLILSLHILPMARSTVIADRYIYLSSIGLFVTVAVYIIPLLNGPKEKLQKKILIGSIIYILSITTYAFWYTIHWM
jgi:hypothetical protein